jgi:uncharacterized protein YdhG (YjbR/CyaY superfamily)
MAKTDFKSAEEYIATLPKATQDVVQEVRAALKAAVPDAEEVISYQIPALKQHGFIFYYSAYKKHISLACPPPFTVFEAFKDELAEYEIAKSSIKFPLDKPMPLQLITAMAAFRAKQNAELEAAKTKA